MDRHHLSGIGLKEGGVTPFFYAQNRNSVTGIVTEIVTAHKSLYIHTLYILLLNMLQCYMIYTYA